MNQNLNLETAQAHLEFIRRTLEAAGQFTAVPGKGLMAAGLIALCGIASNVLLTGAPWEVGRNAAAALDTWGIVLGLSVAVVGWGIYRKSQSTRVPLNAPMVRKVFWSLAPGLAGGGILTHLAVSTNDLAWLPAIWLTCYGVSVLHSGLVSVPPVRCLGVCLLAVAAGAAATPSEMGLIWLSIGFGWLHLVFGAYIAWRHNG